MAPRTIAVGLFAAVVASQSAGQTLSDGAYVCNPAHSYPGATCNGQVATPTLSYYSTSTTMTAASAGQTLSNGGYVCNPAHSYPGATCDGHAATPTLSYYPTSTTAPSAGQTLSNGGYVCNPAHSYPGATCDGHAATPTLSYYPTSSTAPASKAITTSIKPTTSVVKPTTSVVKPTTSVVKPTTSVVKPTTSVVKPTTSVVKPTTSVVKPTTSSAAAKISTLVTSVVVRPTLAASISVCSPAVTKTITVTASQPIATSAMSATPSSKTCPLTLVGAQYQYPHLIVASSDGKKTSGTMYNATVSSKTTTFFNFDIPTSYTGKTCDVVFSLPTQAQLETSSFHLNGAGSLIFSSTAVAAQNADVSTTSSKLGSWTPVPGYHFAVSSGPCAAGKAIGFSVAASGTLALDYFQDYNPCPIGLYVVAR